MKLRHLLAAGAAGAGLATVGNRILQRRSGPLEPALPGAQRTYRWRGMNVAYTEEGDPDATDLLVLHGVNAAASSREFAPIFDDLADDYHVIAPDLPGFGRSDRPPLLYSGSLYASFVTDFARDVTDDPACIASSLSAAYVVEAAREGLCSRLFLVCPTATTMDGRRRAVRTLFRAPIVGTALYNLFTSKPSLRYFGADHAYYDADRATDEGTVAYQWRASHQPGARFAPASFVGGFLDRDLDLGETLATLDVPVTLVWGREADLPPLREGRDLADAADAKLVVVDRARLLPHAEHPEQFVDLVREDVHATERR